ncbi:MAG: hypothetical protein AAFV88_03715 [Planctomycetota bacterium]
MRIPSQFNDSSLYRPRQRGKEGKKRPAKTPSLVNRRLFRMGVALLLVVVVMRQARQPRLYRVFFENANSQMAPVRGGQLVSVRGQNFTSEGKDDFDRPVSRVDPRLMDGWVESMDLELQQAWIGWTTQVLKYSEKPVPRLAELSLAESISLLESQGQRWQPEGSETDAPSSGVTDPIFEWLDELSTRSAKAPSKELLAFADSLLRSLHRVALGRMSDATVWNGKDSDAFNLSLLVDPSDDPKVVSAGVLPLLNQPDVYFGNVIRVRGKLRRGNRVEATANRAGIESYWRLWILPDDGGKRPIQLVVQTLPTELQDGLDQSGAWNQRLLSQNSTSIDPSGEITAAGFFIKRLSYRSQIGADLAPVLVGKIESVRTLQANVARSAASESSSPGEQASGYGGLGILIAVFAGILIAAGIMYRSFVDAKRTRQLRQTRFEMPLDLDARVLATKDRGEES